jgi:hypothetical protein
LLNTGAKAEAGYCPPFPAAGLAQPLTKTPRQYSNGNRSRNSLLSMNAVYGKLAMFKFVVFCSLGCIKKDKTFYATRTEPGCRTATAVSKAVTNQQILPAGESSIYFGMDFMPGKQNTFEEPVVSKNCPSASPKSCFRNSAVGFNDIAFYSTFPQN